MGLVLTLWTYGSSPLFTKQPVRIEWRCVHCYWLTAPTPRCSTVTARARWTWRPHLNSKRDSPVRSVWVVFVDVLICVCTVDLLCFRDPDEFKGHTLLQAAREADMAKVKKTAQEIISFKHPHSHDSALVSAAPEQPEWVKDVLKSDLFWWFAFFPQHCAVASPHPKRKQVTEMLLRKGANIHEKNKEWVLGLVWRHMFVLKWGIRERICFFLLPIIHLTLFSPPSFMTPFHVAAERGHNDVLEVLQKHGAKVQTTLLLACLVQRIMRELKGFSFMTFDLMCLCRWMPLTLLDRQLCTGRPSPDTSRRVDCCWVTEPTRPSSLCRASPPHRWAMKLFSRYSTVISHLNLEYMPWNAEWMLCVYFSREHSSS